MYHFLIAAFGLAVILYAFFTSDNKEQSAIGMTFAITLVLMLQFFAGLLATDDMYQSAKKDVKKIEACEQDLPRSQKCVLIAVPANKD